MPSRAKPRSTSTEVIRSPRGVGLAEIAGGASAAPEDSMSQAGVAMVRFRRAGGSCASAVEVRFTLGLFETGIARQPNRRRDFIRLEACPEMRRAIHSHR